MLYRSTNVSTKYLGIFIIKQFLKKMIGPVTDRIQTCNPAMRTCQL